jgi:hypothetical protein
LEIVFVRTGLPLFTTAALAHFYFTHGKKVNEPAVGLIITGMIKRNIFYTGFFGFLAYWV